MRPIPRDKSFDNTLAMWRDPYRYISSTCRRLESDIFRTRLLLQPAICMTGREAAELFYQQDQLVRHGAMPTRILKTLFGQGGVQGLDGEAHRHRKQMFLSLMTQERIAELARITREQWHADARRWTSNGSDILLYEAAQSVFCRSVCNWAGVPLEEADADRRTDELTALFDLAGSVGPRHWRARRARKRANAWICEVVQRVRAGDLTPPEESAAHVIARHRDLDGQLLDPQTAAVELLNVLRPTVAISVYVVFTALALHDFPDFRSIPSSDETEADERFVQEVRRFYPFFPAVAALVKKDFEWQGYRFPQETRVLLDLYGTNHDPRVWDRPETFHPDRFQNWSSSAFDFIPQGGGDHLSNHRCAGEWVTIELMKVSLEFLRETIDYDVPKQDLQIDYSRMPALPESRFLMANLRMRE